MKHNPGSVAIVIVISALIGAAGAAAQTVAPGSASVRPDDSRRTRTLTAQMLGWKAGVPAGSFGRLTFLEAAAETDKLGLGYVEGSDTQKVSPQIDKNLDFHLTAGERAAVKERLRALRVEMAAYRVETISSDEASLRKLFEFAQSLGVETIVASPDPKLLTVLDRLAGEFGVKVALRNSSRKRTPDYWDPMGAIVALRGHSSRIGLSADIGSWMEEGIPPLEGLAALRGELMGVYLRDRSAFGADGRDVALGDGVAGASVLLGGLYLLDPNPLFLTLGGGAGEDPFSELARSIEAYEHAVQPAIGDRVNRLSRATPITSPARLSAAVRQEIERGLPQQAVAKPKRPRKLLILDICVYGYIHDTIPHANWALKLMGERTGAYEAVFSNDLDNLKYENIRQFDAVFLNSTVGQVFADPEVREGLTRFLREGGGLAAIHGASYASFDWPEYEALIGAGVGPHRVEPATLKIDDPSSPLTAMFAGKSFPYTDEYYRFLSDGMYSRDKLHVLLSVDSEKTDMTAGNPPKGGVRPDNDYGLSWIHSYGKGRVFYCALGHTPTLFMTPSLAKHVLAGIQFALGDLEADTTPSSKLAANKQAKNKK